MSIHIDDDVVITEVLSSILSTKAEIIICFESAKAYITHMNSNHFHEPKLILTDVLMDGISGFELVKFIRKKSSDVKIIVMSGYYGHTSGTPDGLHIDATQCKPFDIEDLLSLVSRLLQKTNSFHKNKAIFSALKAPH